MKGGGKEGIARNEIKRVCGGRTEYVKNVIMKQDDEGKVKNCLDTQSLRECRTACPCSPGCIFI
jgi:hypothetical protein